jgi:hypothetical protein
MTTIVMVLQNQSNQDNRRYNQESLDDRGWFAQPVTAM